MIRQLINRLTPTKDSTPLNSAWGNTKRVRLSWELPKHTVRYEKRNGDGLMGPFGGGWKWQVGVQRGSTDWYITLKTFSISIARKQ